MTIWINNYRESLDLIEKLKELGYEVEHRLTASTVPVIIDDNDYMIVGYGKILRHFEIQ
jgi:hypothetical protein